MPVTNVAKDADALTMTLTAELDAPVERANGGTVMTIVVSFVSAESMQWYLDMDIAEQTSQTFGQIDALLAG
jgi:hypothetical protein